MEPRRFSISLPVGVAVSNPSPTIRNDTPLVSSLLTIQVPGQFAHPLARRVGVGALGCLLKGGADVSDGLESKHAPGAAHLVPQTRHGLKVNPIQGVQHCDAVSYTHLTLPTKRIV